MIQATDALIKATVENECPNTSDEEDPDDDEVQRRVTPAIKKMRMLQMKSVSLTEKEIDLVRKEILKDAETGVFDIVGKGWKDKFDTFLEKQTTCRAQAAQEGLDGEGKIMVPKYLRGGTKRRKSKRRKGTKRKLK